MELMHLWLLLRWEFGQTATEKVLSQLVSLVLSTGYWLSVAAALTFIVSRIS